MSFPSPAADRDRPAVRADTAGSAGVAPADSVLPVSASRRRDVVELGNDISQLHVSRDTRGTVSSPLIEPYAIEDEAETLLGWQERALCAQTDPEAFFPEKGGSTREAKRVCTRCDVRGDCLEYALDHDERFGIWGGLSERERRRLRRRAV